MSDDELRKEAEALCHYDRDRIIAALRRVRDAERQRCAAIADYWHTVCAREIRLGDRAAAIERGEG